MSNHSTIEKDEINLSELLIPVFKHKLLIFLITMMTTMGGMAYSWITKPIYEGNILLEIGEVIFNSDNSMIKPLESNNDLIQLLSKTYTAYENDDIEFNTLSSSTLLHVSYMHNDKKTIHAKLQEISQFVIKRHEEKANFFKKANFIIRPTVISSAINVSPNPVKPNKYLIIVISFFGGLILSLFIVLLIEFFTKHHLFNQKNNHSTI